ncbi:hypothetical protein [Pseudoduganella umbonata]|uniref:Uncharacterized protein n=1 Tax=Pseudoduganella umbonata TaxID=864828 RepID=A0A4P8HPZ4_9BURK|nr:hypothetical protein [Pseudoduganella umbonata]MBB3221372.1 hypothetical protein [Pseudoduganella umbonata]QCP10534.1 hypothetical protein FCL38_08895 [Pseudoduganella umbonata]
MIDALERRLEAWPVGLVLPREAVVDTLASERERSGTPAGMSCQPADEPRFVRTSRGWTWRDHASLAWHTDGPVAHRHLSELEHRYDVIVSEQPDMAGVPRLTVDLHALQSWYERDAVQDGDCDLGSGWARLTLRWSLRLQLVVTAAGRANVVTRVNQMAPRTDTGRTGPYISADTLARLLDVRRLTREWERGGASLGAVRDQLVSRLAAAIEPPLARHAAHYAFG